MPFIKIDVDEEIAKRMQQLEFKKAWKENHAEHKLIGEMISLRKQNKITQRELAILTGNKLKNKIYYRHTGYIGGLKAVSYEKLMAENPEKAMLLAIKGMLPHNSLGRKMITKVRIYKGAEHENAAQKPEVYNG